MSKNNGFDIEYVGYGMANRFTDKYIEIHKKLKQPQYSDLLKEIIEHEISHTDEGYKWYDLALDLKGFKNKWQYYKFIITTPTSWVQFIPIYKSRRGWHIDISIFMLWVFAILVTWVVLFIIGVNT